MDFGCCFDVGYGFGFLRKRFWLLRSVFDKRDFTCNYPITLDDTTNQDICSFEIIRDSLTCTVYDLECACHCRLNRELLVLVYIQKYQKDESHST